jgi:hypothetical protein
MALGGIIVPLSNDGSFTTYYQVNGALMKHCTDADDQIEYQGQGCVSLRLGDDVDKEDANHNGSLSMDGKRNGEDRIVEAPGLYQNTYMNTHEKPVFYPAIQDFNHQDLESVREYQTSHEDQEQMNMDMYPPLVQQYPMPQYHPAFGQQGRPRRCFSFQRHTALPTIVEGSTVEGSIETYPSCPFCKAGQTTAIGLVNHLIHDDCPNAPCDEAILDRALQLYDPDGSITRRVDELVDFFTTSTTTDEEVETINSTNIEADAALDNHGCLSGHASFRRAEKWHSHMASSCDKEQPLCYPDDQHRPRSSAMDRIVHHFPHAGDPTGEQDSAGQETMYTTIQREGTVPMESSPSNGSKQHAGRRRSGHVRNRSIVINPSVCQSPDMGSRSRGECHVDFWESVHRLHAE